MGLINWTGRKHNWDRGTTTVITTTLTGRTGRHRAGKSNCQFCSRQASLQAGNGVKVCRTHGSMLA